MSPSQPEILGEIVEASISIWIFILIGISQLDIGLPFNFVWDFLSRASMILLIPMCSVNLDEKVYWMFSELTKLNYNFFVAWPELVESTNDPENPVFFNSRYEIVGIEAHNIFINTFEIFGTVAFTLAIYILSRMSYACIKNWNLPKVKRRLEGTIVDFQYNFFIRLFLESYLLVLLYSMINVEVFHRIQNFDHTVSLVSGIFSVLLLAGLLYMIYKSYKIVNHNPEKYDDEDYAGMFGEIVADLNWKVKWARSYQVVFMAHKLAFCFCVITLGLIPFLQVFLIWWNQLYFLVYLIVVKPFDTKLKTRMSIFNGVIALFLYTMCFLSLDDFVAFRILKKPIGSIFIYTFIGFAAVNLIVPFIDFLIHKWRELKKNRARERRGAALLN